MKNYNWLFDLIDYFGGVENLENYEDLGIKVAARREGKQFTFSDHLKGLVYALLTNQRSWSGIAEMIPQINELFYQFDVKMIKKTNPATFAKGIMALRCGNVATKRQMDSLHANILVLEQIEKDYGSLDEFVESADANTIVEMLSNKDSKYKIQGLGKALAWEYLRNVGVDGAKPDIHMRRFLSSDRVGNGSKGLATEDEVIAQVDELSKASQLDKWLIDNLIWEYCSEGGEDICGEEPQCGICILKRYCKYKG